MARILIVDDCESQRDLLQVALGRDHQIDSAEDASTARDSIASERPDLIVLDIELPDLDGFGFAAELRQHPTCSDIPIIFLSGRLETSDKVMAFALGAQDYVEKPFAPAELRARVSARLGESSPKRMGFRYGDLRLDPDRMCVTCEADRGARIELTATELRLLQFLLCHAGEVVTRGELITHAWNGRIVSERTIDTHVWTLRKKLVESRCSVETVRGVGYRFV